MLALPRRDAASAGPDLEARLSAVESQLAELGNALRTRDSAAIDRHAVELHRALASAVNQFSVAAKDGPLPHALRHRLAEAGGKVAAQRESLARATAALDRAIDVLLPRENTALYAANGSADRGGAYAGGVIRA